MLEFLRDWWHDLLTPLAKGLLKMHISPDVVTWVGTIATCLVAIICFPRGWFWQGVAILLVFILSDTLDGTMARLAGRESPWGSFLDATLDRISDGALFAGVILYYAGPGDSLLWAAAGLGALVFAEVTSYSKARGEACGFRVHGGLATRADRIFLLLLGVLLVDLGVDWALPVALCYLLVAGLITLVQRILQVYSQSHQVSATEGNPQ